MSKNDLSVFFSKIYFATAGKDSSQFIIYHFQTYAAKLLRTFFYIMKKNYSQQNMRSLYI